MDSKVAQKIYLKLQYQVETAQRLRQPIDIYVQQQIKLLEEVHDSFVKNALSKNADLERDLRFAEVRIKQLQAIASLCKKIGLSTQKYDDKIREIRISHLGADFVKERYK